MLISSNAYLSKAQAKDNAQFIMSYFFMQGWTKNAIAAMLGNMEVESTINPGIWQGRIEFRFDKGFGLVQWTPASKYIEWAALNGAVTYEEYKQLDPQCRRIQYEVDNDIQWISDLMTFFEFTQSTNPDLKYLSDRFCWGYERPADPDLVLRGENTVYWYNNLFYGAAREKKKSNFFVMLGKPNIY